MRPAAREYDLGMDYSETITGGGSISITVTTSSLATYMSWLFGGSAVLGPEPDADRWMDDGGPSVARDYGYEHLLRSV
jgi:hypothetical protein